VQGRAVLTNEQILHLIFFWLGSHHGGSVDKLVERDFEKNSRAGLIKTGGAGVPVPGFGFRGGESMGQGNRGGAW